LSTNDAKPGSILPESDPARKLADVLLKNSIGDWIVSQEYGLRFMGGEFLLQIPDVLTFAEGGCPFLRLIIPETIKIENPWEGSRATPTIQSNLERGGADWLLDAVPNLGGYRFQSWSYNHRVDKSGIFNCDVVQVTATGIFHAMGNDSIVASIQVYLKPISEEDDDGKQSPDQDT
jgi:hypothetical protein